MNAERLLALFERISEAPDAISRLRRFILELAVRGKLVPQDQRDEPSAELLQAITAEKDRLARSGEIKKPKPLPEVEEIPFALPSNWRWTRLGNVASYIQRGKSPTYAISDGSPVISQKCVQWSGLNLAAARQITVESLANYESSRFLRDGDLLWNSTGTGTIGRIIKVVDPPENLVCDSHVTVVRCLEVDPEYIRTWLRSDHVYALIEERAAGSTNQVELTAQMATNQPVPLPPLAEQHRIVAKVDKLMTLCDQLEAARTQQVQCRERLVAASLQRLDQPSDDPEALHGDARFALQVLPSLTSTPAQIKQLRKTILNLAVRGELVEQDPEDESADRLLEHIANERERTVFQGRSRAREEFSQIPEDKLPFLAPEGWTWARIGALILASDYGTSQKAHALDDGVPVLTMGNIADGLVKATSKKKIPFTSDELPRLYLKKFDILYNRTNSAELVGKTGIYQGESDLMTFASYLIRLRPSLAWSNPRFLNMAMNTSEFRRTQIVPCIKKQTGQANVNGTALRNMLLPLPPLAEQHRIVAKVDKLMTLCDQLEQQLSQAEQGRRGLLETMLQEALGHS
jgi:type I restriction enzyme S subunit